MENVANRCESNMGGYSHNGITLYNEDCLNILDTMQEKSVDLIVTDCPYHIVSRWL